MVWGVPPKRALRTWAEVLAARPRLASCESSFCSQVSAILSTPLWEWFLQRFGKRMSAFGICVSEAGGKAWAGDGDLGV